MSNCIDVLVVGAGPVGLNMALALQNQGVSCRVIDTKSGPETTSNSLGVNARTLEIWNAMGFAHEAIEEGLCIKEIKVFSGNKLLNYAPIDKIESEFNFMLSLPQAQTETLLISVLNKRGINVEWNTLLTGLDDTEDDVLCTTNKETIKAKWVVGCDGYHSKTRELAGIPQDCRALAQHYIMMDAKISVAENIDGTVSLDEVSGIFHSSGVMFFIPMRDKVRIIAEISKDPKYKNLTEPTAEAFSAILNERHPGVKIQSVEWLSSFNIHECIAASFRKKHVFLAGDAGHSHSPVGAQGTNTGIQDSWNLAWKLAHVIKGEALPKILDTYNIERRGIANDVLKRSGWMTKVATTDNKFIQLLRNLGVGGILSIDLVRNRIVNSLAQTDICYLNSPLIDSNQILFQNKTTFPTKGKNWLLLSKDDIFENTGLPPFVDLVHDHLYWSDQPLCLVRPDGYIAMYADSIFEVSGYFVENGFQQF